MVATMTPENAGQIETKGYNRGLILGFTMAESLLLVVFCLLLVTAAIIVKERRRAEEAITRLSTVTDTNLQQNQKIEELKAEVAALASKLPQSEQADYDEDWRELVLQKDTFKRIKELLGRKDAAEILSRVQALMAAEQQVADLRKANEQLSERQIDLSSQLDSALKRLEAREVELAKLNASGKPHEWPPIISLTEANGYFFRSGSAELTTPFTDQLSSSISDQIAKNLESYGADIVEVIGHTDEQPIARLTSNLDKNSIDVLAARKSITSLEPADNAGLGIARAISVGNVLRANKLLAGVTVLPLSAAQLILPGDTLTVGQAGNVESRRRIEIRIRRRDAALQ
jgi:flagellar motor protein MotB